MRSSDKEWEAWGNSDPYFGVVSDVQFHGVGDAQSREEFFRSGEEFVGTVLAEAEANLGPIAKGHALDFGSGVARLTRPLAAIFDRTVGVDVSAGMRAEASRNCQAQFVASLNELTGPFDFVLSYIVLQHIPVGIGYGLIEHLLALLNPGGVAMLHVSTKRNYRLKTALAYWLKHTVPGAKAILNAMQGKPPSTPVMQMNEYDLGKVLAIFDKAGLRNIRLTPEVHHDVDTVRILGRKA